MKILFIGDSITKGGLGESFVNCIQLANPGFTIRNLGEDGETLNLILERLLRHLRETNDYDLIVLQGGYNDLLLPTFPAKGKLFHFAYRQQLKKGNRPLSLSGDEMFSFFQQSIRKLKAMFKGRIILVTLGCLGENLQSDLNKQRNQFNAVLKRLSAMENISIADTQAKFDAVLTGKATSDYCLDNFWAITIIDRFTTILSKKRNLFLTIDGVHLNKRGANLFAESVMEAINVETVLPKQFNRAGRQSGS